MNPYLSKTQSHWPRCAYAQIHGSPLAPHLNGLVRFFDTPCGVWVEAEVHNLPPNKSGFYGFHIHEKGDCTLDNNKNGNYYLDAGEHYNPTKTPHPRHAGDLPMLLATQNDTSRLYFLTDRFTVDEIIDRSVIIHMERDDYTSQPSGDSGARIGCGIITPV